MEELFSQCAQSEELEICLQAFSYLKDFIGFFGLYEGGKRKEEEQFQSTVQRLHSLRSQRVCQSREGRKLHHL